MDGPQKEEGERLSYTFKNVRLISIHKTTRIESFYTIIDENRYVFKNLGTKRVRYIILPPRIRDKERELKIDDRNHASLPLISPENANSLFIEMCENIFNPLTQNLKEDVGQEEFQKIKREIRKNIEGIFKYSINERYFDNFKKNFNSLLKYRGRVRDDKSVDFMIRLIEFLEEYVKGKYYPLVFLTPESEAKGLILIDESVKRVGEYFPFGAPYKFRYLGNFTFPYRIEPSPLVSCSYGLITPKGLVMKNINFNLEGKSEKRFDGKRICLDDDHFRLKVCSEEFEKMPKSEELEEIYNEKKEYLDGDYFILESCTGENKYKSPRGERIEYPDNNYFLLRLDRKEFERILESKEIKFYDEKKEYPDGDCFFMKLNKNEFKRVLDCRIFERNHNKDKGKYFDNDYFHLTLDENDSEDISKCKERMIDISFGLSEPKLNFGILTILIIILWLCILFPSWSRLLYHLSENIFPNIDLDKIGYFSVIGVCTPILVAIAVYSIDKNILKEFISTQIHCMTMVFLLELFYFETDNPTTPIWLFLIIGILFFKFCPKSLRYFNNRSWQ